MPRSSLLDLCGALAVLVFPLAILHAQSSSDPAQRGIHGRVVHAVSDTPISSAGVDLTNLVTGTLAGHVVTAANGTFDIPRLSPGQYRVTVRALGFAPKILPPVTLTAAHPDVDVGTVTLTEIPLELQSQAITAQREEVQTQPDRTTYVVRDMPTTKGGTALDVLRNVPSVDVDIDNNVSLRGNSGVIIQINGGPAR